MTLFTKDNCPRCDMLKSKLKAKGVDFVEEKNEEIIEGLGFDFLPILQVDGKFLELSQANDYVNSL